MLDQKSFTSSFLTLLYLSQMLMKRLPTSNEKPTNNLRQFLTFLGTLSYKERFFSGSSKGPCYLEHPSASTLIYLQFSHRAYLLCTRTLGRVSTEDGEERHWALGILMSVHLCLLSCWLWAHSCVSLTYPGMRDRDIYMFSHITK